MVLQHAISRLRYEQNLTQEEVARKLQLSQSVVGKIERNAMDVKLTDLVRYVEHSWRKALAASRSSFRKKDLRSINKF